MVGYAYINPLAGLYAHVAAGYPPYTGVDIMYLLCGIVLAKRQ